MILGSCLSRYPREQSQRQIPPLTLSERRVVGGMQPQGNKGEGGLPRGREKGEDNQEGVLPS